jgi:glycosyltransferase involved in cell wall biosynthesis
MTTTRPRLLFVTPIMPAASGNGLAIRAGVFLDALAQDYEVTLLHVPVSGAAPRNVPAFVAARARRVLSTPLDGALDPLWSLLGRIADPDARAAALTSYPRPAPCRWATAAWASTTAAMLGDATFDHVHVMRSYLAPYAERFLAGPATSLDLDDDESSTHLRLAESARQRGDEPEARRLTAESSKFVRHEAAWLPRFGTLIACTDAHGDRLARRISGCRVAIVPNTVALPPMPPMRPHAHRHLLFVGNLSYRPNVDGICGFARDVLPRLHALSGPRIVLRIAGSTPHAEVKALTALAGVELLADPPDLAPSYAWANLAVIPLAAGGGTRIKLLEAFAYGVPVVATSIGAEGIDARHGTHLLIADTPADFSDACARLLADPAAARALAGAARSLVETHYAHAEGVRRIRSALGVSPRPPAG